MTRIAPRFNENWFRLEAVFDPGSVPNQSQSGCYLTPIVPNLVAKLKEEMRQVLVIAVFFGIGFSIIILNNRLVTAGTGIHIAPFARALVGGLIVAKVLMIVDLLPFVHAFPEKPLVHNVSWKSSLYVAASVIFLYLEPFLKNLIKGLGLYGSHSAAWHELMLPKTWATLLWLAVLMVGFVTMQELSHVLGKERLKAIFFGDRKKKASTETQLRGAA